MIGYLWWFCMCTILSVWLWNQDSQRHYTVFGARNQCEGSLSWCIVPQALSAKKRRPVSSLFDSKSCHITKRWRDCRDVLLECLINHSCHVWCVMFCEFANEAIKLAPVDYFETSQYWEFADMETRSCLARESTSETWITCNLSINSISAIISPRGLEAISLQKRAIWFAVFWSWWISEKCFQWVQAFLELG